MASRPRFPRKARHRLIETEEERDERRRRSRRHVLFSSVVAAVLLLVPAGATGLMTVGKTVADPQVAVPAPGGRTAARSGAFLGSGERGANAVAAFDAWRGRPSTVGHTYLPGHTWADVEGPSYILDPWTAWRRADPGRVLVLNVPMSDQNEDGLSDDLVAAKLRSGAAGTFAGHYRRLAEQLVASGAGDTILVLGWEMNGSTYSGRCSPDPGAWKAYWRNIVSTMRGVPGAAFRFDFTASRGTDAIPWTTCYPGDEFVDIVGMDTYDQQPGHTFADFVAQPLGLQAQVEFAAAHRKPVSYPEWGLYRQGDNPDFVRGMHDWITTHDVLYETVTDYCPHGVWECGDRNPRSARAYLELFGRQPAG